MLGLLVENHLWASALARLKTELGDLVFSSWISPLVLRSYSDDKVILSTSSMFFRDWVTHNYAADILRACQKDTSSLKFVEIVVGDVEEFVDSSKDSLPTSNGESSVAFAKDEHNDVNDQINKHSSVGISLDPTLTFENFIVGKTNELAYAAAQRVADSQTVSFNPLFLYGGVGLGKTHLMHAIAWSIRDQNPARRVIYMSAEKFMYHFIRAVRFKDTMSFKDQFRSVDVLMIDDIQFICGKDSTQEEFFHTFNALIDNNRQVIVSADKSPSDLDGMEERLKSRLGWGLVADIYPTNYELRLGILQSKAAAANICISDKVLEFLATKITSNIRELEGALNRVIANSTLIGKEITIDSTVNALSDLLRTSERKITVEDIQKRVATHYSIRLSDMFSSKRAKEISRPRQIAMYLSKQLTSLSLPDIGKKFGGRDHTTVLHSVKKINEILEKDQSLAEDIRLLKQSLDG